MQEPTTRQVSELACKAHICSLIRSTSCCSETPGCTKSIACLELAFELSCEVGVGDLGSTQWLSKSLKLSSVLDSSELTFEEDCCGQTAWPSIETSFSSTFNFSIALTAVVTTDQHRCLRCTYFLQETQQFLFGFIFICLLLFVCFCFFLLSLEPGTMPNTQ